MTVDIIVSSKESLMRENARLKEAIRQIKRYTYTLDVSYLSAIHDLAEEVLTKTEGR